MSPNALSASLGLLVRRVQRVANSRAASRTPPSPMILYLAFIALVNTVIGFAAAVYFVPPAALASLTLHAPSRKLFRRRRKSVGDAPLRSDDEAGSDSASPPREATSVATTNATSESRDEDARSATSDDASIAIPDDESAPILTDEELAEQIPAEWLTALDEYGIQAAALVEASAQVLRLEVGNYRDRLVKLDTRARDKFGVLEPNELRAMVEELNEINRAWLEKQAESTRHLASRADALGSQGPLARRLVEILENQQAQIESTANNLAEFNFESDTQGCGIRLLKENRKMLDLAHALRDQMFGMLLEIKKVEDRLSEIGLSMMTDRLTKLYNRAGLEKTLHEQFLSDGCRKRQLSCALIDIDHFLQIMDSHGPAVGDMVIVSVGQVLADMLRSDRGFDMMTRFDGQRFFALMADTGPRGAMSAAERMRQTIEHTTYEYGGDEIELTISSGVVELGADESLDDLYRRLEAATHAAKKSGRNCTALDEGDGPNRVEAPEYNIKGKIVQLA